MANLMALPAPKRNTPMTATQIGNFLSSSIRPLVSVNAKGEKDYLNSMIDKLIQMQKDSKDAEERAYDILGVKSLEELQNKLDTLNREGLYQLTNEALRKMPAIKKAQSNFVPVQTIRDTIEKEFVAYLTNGEGNQTLMDIAEGLSDEALEELLQKFHDFEKTKLGIKKNSLVAGIKRKPKGKKKLEIVFNDFTKTRKKELKKRLHLESNSSEVRGEQHNEELVITIEPYDFGQLKYYPYFGLTEEQKVEIEEDEELWENFVQAVSSCVGNKLRPHVSATMKGLMGKKAFISTGGSYADIVGVLGELQTLTFLGYLGASKGLAPKFLGHAVNNNNDKVGVDVALENIGFQVKNYKMYGTRETRDEGINLNGKYKLKNFLDLISENFSDPNMADNLEKFYAISAYHIKAHEDFGNIRDWMDRLQQTQLPKIYHGAIGELLPLKQISWIDKETGDNGISKNAFYLIGGSRILPVSKILSLYIKFLEELKNGIDNPKLIAMHNGGVKYSGTDTYMDYYLDQENYNFVGYSAIADKISISYNINLNVDYSIEEVLSKAIKI